MPMCQCQGCHGAKMKECHVATVRHSARFKGRQGSRVPCYWNIAQDAIVQEARVLGCYVTLPECQGAWVPQCKGAIIPGWHTLPSYQGARVAWGAMMPRRQGAILSCQGTMLPWYQGARLPLCQGTMVPGWQGAIAPGCHCARLP